MMKQGLKNTYLLIYSTEAAMRIFHLSEEKVNTIAALDPKRTRRYFQRFCGVSNHHFQIRIFSALLDERYTPVYFQDGRRAFWIF